jgi:ribonuclease R
MDDEKMSTKLSKTRKKDPYFQREAARYERPLPSREYVLMLLEEQGRPVSCDRLCALLDVGEDEQESLGRRLAAMEREGQLMRNR